MLRATSPRPIPHLDLLVDSFEETLDLASRGDPDALSSLLAELLPSLRAYVRLHASPELRRLESPGHIHSEPVGSRSRRSPKQTPVLARPGFDVARAGQGRAGARSADEHVGMTIPVQVPRTFEDWTRDGRPDVLVGASQIGTGAGYAEVLEGTTGKRAFPRPPFVGKAKGDAFGHHVAYVGDVNGDGVGDVSIGAPARAAGRGSASVYSRDRLRLATDLHRLSVKQGGTQTLTLAAGKQQANKLYLLVGSLSGTKPGIPLGNNVHLPLNLDSYMRLTLGAPNSAMLSNSLGRLDASGNATAKWNVIPALPQPPVQGFLLHHAYVVIDLTRLSFDFASNAVPLRLLR